jgi:tetratricopeptide (TPR) repeat protein
VLQQRLEAALEAARARGDEMEEAYCLETLATLAHYLDQDPERAVAYHEACIAIYRRRGELYYLAQNLTRLGEAYQLLGKTDRTRRLVNEAIEIQRRIGDIFGEGESIRAQGMTAWQTGDYAGTTTEELLALYQRTGYVVGQATAYFFLGYIQMTTGQLQEGLAHVRTALELALDVADFSTQAWCYALFGFEAGLRGDIERARQYLSSAEAIDTDPFRQTGAGHPFVQLHINLVRFLVTAAESDPSRAAGHLLQPLQLATMTDSQPYMAIFLALSVLVYDHLGRHERAAELVGLVARQSKVAVGWLEHYAPYHELQVRLAQRLGPQGYAAALQRGDETPLLSATEEALRDFARGL